jgi:hypothetical protein
VASGSFRAKAMFSAKLQPQPVQRAQSLVDVAVPLGTRPDRRHGVAGDQATRVDTVSLAVEATQAILENLYIL